MVEYRLIFTALLALIKRKEKLGKTFKNKIGGKKKCLNKVLKTFVKIIQFGNVVKENSEAQTPMKEASEW